MFKSCDNLWTLLILRLRKLYPLIVSFAASSNLY